MMTTVLNAGAEFQVNTFTQDAQSASSVAALSDGGFVITWMSYGQDGPWRDEASYGIYAQRYDATGTAVGQEFRVNTTTNNFQERPAAEGLADGGFVVTWQGASPPQQSNTGEIYAQLYDASGSPVGSEFIVNSSSQNLQEQSSVAALTTGGFVVTWTSQQGDSRNDVFGKIYSSDGVPVTGDIRLNSTLAGDQQVSSVVGLADGGFVVAWASNVSGDNDIYAQRYNSSGVAVGSELLVNSYTAQNQTSPSVASLAGGGFAVTWRSYGEDGDGNGVYARIYDANGAPVGSAFQVNTYALNSQEMPSITGLTNGGFLVTWASAGQDGVGADHGVYGQLYDSDGLPQGTEFLVNSHIPGSQQNPSVAALPSGGVVVAWESYPQDGSDLGVYAKLFANEAPTAASVTSSPLSLPEDLETTARVPVGSVVIADDALGTNTISLTGDDAELFELGGTGLYLKAATVLDFETNPNLDVTVNVADPSVPGSTPVSTDVSIAITNVNEAPTLAASANTAAVAENTTATGITFMALDVDSTLGLANFVLSGTDAAKFRVEGSGSSSDPFALVLNEAPDFEAPTDSGANNVYDVSVAVTDGELASSPVSLSIAVADVYEGPPPIVGTSGNDRLTGTSGDDFLDALAGDDRVSAAGGNDRIIGGAGRDTIDGDSGNDTIIATVGDGNDVYRGGNGTDTVDYSAIAASVRILLSASATSSQTGTDTLSSLENAVGGSAADVITGNGSMNVLSGGDGNDTIDGGGGSDRIEGGLGSNNLTGGSGTDVSVFKPGFGNDVITDFDANPKSGQDRIDISAFSISAEDFSTVVAIDDIGAHTLVTIGADPNQTILLRGIDDASVITSEDFLL